jgi:hypothetical protein
MRFVAVIASLCVMATDCASGSSNASATSSPSAAPATGATSASTSPLEGSGGGGLTFHGFPCKSTCLGHERGYEWAEEHSIDDPHTCYSGPRLSNSEFESFSEGCEAYVDESTGASPLDTDERYSGVGAGDDGDNN